MLTVGKDEFSDDFATIIPHLIIWPALVSLLIGFHKKLI